ncbi:MAG: phosphate-starvation-inducible PsiE family protein [Candidatus Aquicultor sp.]|nr:phosphate-starvation-inducible PsiE family protein [Candidatus Aquicultor sp.]
MATNNHSLHRKEMFLDNAVLKKIFVTDCRKKVLIKSYRSVSNLIIDALIIAVLIALVAGTVRIFLHLPSTLSQDYFSGVFHNLLNDVMVIFIFVELFRVLLDYFKEERVKITYIADATLVFTFKEIWIRFSETDFDPIKILAMAGAMLAVVAVRTLAVIYSPDRARE